MNSIGMRGNKNLLQNEDNKKWHYYYTTLSSYPMLWFNVKNRSVK